MVVSCSAFNCSQRFIKNSGISFHTFPKDPIRRSQWVLSMKRKNFKPSSSSRICGKHFERTCYKRQFGQVSLVDTAIPTIFDFPDHLQKPKKIRRVLRRPSTSSSTECGRESSKVKEVLQNTIQLKKKSYIGDFSQEDLTRIKGNHRTLPYVDCSDPSIERNNEMFKELLSDPLVDTKSNITLIDGDQQDIKPDIKQEIKQEHDVINNFCEMEIENTSPDVEIVQERCDINQFTNETHQPITITGIYYTEAVINLENDSSPNVNSNSNNKDIANISQKKNNSSIPCDELSFSTNEEGGSLSCYAPACNICKNTDVAFRISGSMTFTKSVCPEEQSVIFHNYCGPRVDDFCRLCSNDRRGVDMYVDIFNTKRDIQTMISTCLQVKVTMDDDLPKKICKKCYYSLEKAYLFQEKTKRAEKNLLRLFRLQDNASESVESSNNIISEEFNSIMNIDNNPILNLKENDDKLLINLEVRRKDDGFYCPFCPRCVKSKQALGTHIELIHLDVNERQKVIRHFRESEDTNLSVGKIVKPNKPESLSNTREILIEKDSEDITNKFNQTDPKCSNFDNINNSDECLLSSGDTNNCDLNIFNKDSSCTERLSSGEIEGIQEENLNQVVEEIQTASRLASQRQIRIQGEIHGYGCKAKFCHKRFKTMVMKSLHEESEHGKDINVYSCTICKQVFSNVVLILDHLSRVHQEVVKEDKLIPSPIRYLFSCDFCCVLYATYADLIKHKSSCSGLKIFLFTCYCSKQFFKQVDLITHIRTHNSILDYDDPALQRPTCKVFYGCHLCQMIFTSTQGSIQHSMKHPRTLTKARN